MELNDSTRIVVTGANGLVGRMLLMRLRETHAQTIAVIRSEVELPAKRIIAAPLNSPQAVAAIKDADYVVHLAGTLYPTGRNSYKDANVDTAEAVANALKNGKAKRVLFLSYVGASEDSKNPYLHSKAIAEQLLRTTGKEVVVFRCTHIIGPPDFPGPLTSSMLMKQGKKANVLGDGRQVVAPVYVGDVVTALLAAMKTGSPGIYELAGPEQMSMNDLARLLNRNPEVRIAHVSNWFIRFLGRILPMLPSPFVDVILSDSVGDSSRAKSVFEFKLTSLRTIWR